MSGNRTREMGSHSCTGNYNFYTVRFSIFCESRVKRSGSRSRSGSDEEEESGSGSGTGAKKNSVTESVAESVTVA